MRAILILALLAVAGCATTQPPEPTERIIYVDKPVAINCINAAPARPLYRTENLPTNATDIDYADALRIDWVASRAYEFEMEKAVNACLIPD